MLTPTPGGFAPSGPFLSGREREKQPPSSGQRGSQAAVRAAAKYGRSIAFGLSFAKA
ncbi:hypothetical protein CHELA40_11606 [Chelatococcus asaccharovorans]|nr:hypothetical protein CHELA40_11606 [Chelatococcus asaccharovorans]